MPIILNPNPDSAPTGLDVLLANRPRDYTADGLAVFALIIGAIAVFEIIRRKRLRRLEEQEAIKRSAEEAKAAGQYYQQKYSKQAADLSGRETRDRAEAEKKEQRQRKYQQEEALRQEQERKRQKEREEQIRQDENQKQRERKPGGNSGDLQSALELLGLSPGFLDQAEARRKYLHLVKYFAADTGGSSRLHQQINEAWEVVKSHHGWK